MGLCILFFFLSSLLFPQMLDMSFKRKPIVLFPSLKSWGNFLLPTLAVFKLFLQAGTLGILQISSVQFSCSVMSDFLWPHGLQHARPPCPSPNPRVYPNMSTESVMPSSHLILCRPLLLPPSIFPSIRVFSNESTLHIRWPKYWRFSFNISPSKWTLRTDLL